MLKDTTFSSTRGLRCSIDLNGNNLSSSGTTNYSNTLTILDSKGTGKITGSISFYTSNITVQSAETIEHLMLTDRSTATILGGKVNKINANVNSLNIAGGEINNLCIYNSSNIHLSGGTINNFTFVSIPTNFDMLNDGYIYASIGDNTPIKKSEMTPSTQVAIIECPHPTFTDTVCDYCNYVCKHSGHYNLNGICEICNYVCNHENHYNTSGICEICNHICSHLELNENNVCLECKQPIQASLKNSSTIKNFIKFEDAIASIQTGDTLTLCRNITLENSLSIDAICSLDLYGYSLDGYYINLNNKISAIDSIGNGHIAISAYSSSCQIELRGHETTNFTIMANASKIKFYSGRIIRIGVSNGTIDSILPSGYMFLKYKNSSVTKMTKQETNITSFYEDNYYLTCQVCEHDSVNDDLSCKYCGTTLTQEQIMQALAKDLENTKQELNHAIAKKEDIASINEKVKTLNDTISSTEIICKAYADSTSAQLKTSLESLLSSAKEEAINYSNQALDQARTSLNNALNQKLDIDQYTQKVQELTDAINNAETASKAYADSQDSALRTELLDNINNSKTTLQNANNEMLDRLTKAESKIDANAKDINYLKTGLVVISIIFGVVILGGFISMYLLIKKKKW